MSGVGPTGAVGAPPAGYVRAVLSLGTSDRQSAPHHCGSVCSRRGWHRSIPHGFRPSCDLVRCRSCFGAGRRLAHQHLVACCMARTRSCSSNPLAPGLCRQPLHLARHRHDCRRYPCSVAIVDALGVAPKTARRKRQEVLSGERAPELHQGRFGDRRLNARTITERDAAMANTVMRGCRGCRANLIGRWRVNGMAPFAKGFTDAPLTV